MNRFQASDTASQAFQVRIRHRKRSKPTFSITYTASGCGLAARDASGCGLAASLLSATVLTSCYVACVRACPKTAKMQLADIFFAEQITCATTYGKIMTAGCGASEIFLRFCN
jgi:hypothetical protein